MPKLAKTAILSMKAKKGDHIVHYLLMALHYHGPWKITAVSNFFLWYEGSSKNTLNKCSIRSDTLTVQFQGNQQSPIYWTQRTGYGTTPIWTGHVDAANGALSTHVKGRGGGRLTQPLAHCARGLFCGALSFSLVTLRKVSCPVTLFWASVWVQSP